MGTGDQELLDRWYRGRDAMAFKEIADRHAPMVLGTCRRILGNATEAEDAAQECFEKLARHGVGSGKYLGAWLHRVATNHALNHLRAQKRQTEREQRYAAERGAAVETDWDDIYPHVDEALAQLPEKLREPILLHFFEGQTQVAIGQKLGCARATVNHRIHEGVERLREELKRRGVLVVAGALEVMLGKHAAAQTISVTLTERLARIALAGPGAATGMALGGVSVGIKSLIAASVVVVAAAGWWAATTRDAPPPAEILVANGTQSTPPAAEVPPQDATVPNLSSASASTESALSTFIPDGDPFAPSTSGLGKISGRVYEAESTAPLPDVHVFLEVDTPKPQNPWESLKEKRKTIESRTGTDGRYAFEDIPEGRYRVQRSSGANGLPMVREQEIHHVYVKNGQVIDDLDIKVETGARISGVVLDEDGNPASGATVEARDRTDSQSLQVAHTGAGGRFVIYGIKPTRQLTLQAERNVRHENDFHFSEQLGPLELEKDGLSGVVLTLHPGGGVSGVLVDSRGRPLSNVQVAVSWPWSDTRPLMGDSSENTDAQGRFEVVGVAGGVRRIMLLREDRIVYEYPTAPGDNIELEHGEFVTGLRLVFDGPDIAMTSMISGRILDEQGKPIGNAEIEGSGPGREFGRSDLDGEFSIETDASGVYTLSVSHPEHAKAVIAGIEAGSEGVDIVLSAKGMIEGRVLDAKTGEPIEQFEILHLDDQNRYQTNVRTRFNQMRDADGMFLLHLVEPGPATLIARAKGYGEGSAEVPAVLSGETVKGIEVRLEPGLMLTGVVVDASGAPVADVGIIPGEMPSGESPEAAVVTRTDSTGTFRLDDLSGSLSLISAYHPDYAPVSSPVALATSGDNAVRIVMTQGGIVEGIVYLDGAPLADVVVNFIGSPRQHQQTGEAGAFRFERVSPGPASLFTSFLPRDGDPRSDTRTQVKKVVIEDGETLQADIHFRVSTSSVEGIITRAGEPVSGSRIALYITTVSDMEVLNASTGGDGTYRLASVPEGSAQMRVYLPEGSVRTLRFEILPNETLRQDLELSAGATLHGVVIGLKSSETATVALFYGEVAFDRGDYQQFMMEHFLDIAASTNITANGPYEVGGLDPGVYTLVGNPYSRTAADAVYTARVVTAIIEIGAEPEHTLDLVFE